MKILKIFGEKLRNKNYSNNTIKLYVSYLKLFLEKDIKDPYQVRTQRIISFLNIYIYKDKTMSKEMREHIDRVKNWKQFLNKSVNEGEFGFGEFPKPKTEIWIQFMNRALKDGLISQIHYGDKRIQNIAKELANEFENMEEPNRQSNKDLFLGMFYDRIPRWAWGEPTNSILMKYGLKKS